LLLLSLLLWNVFIWIICYLQLVINKLYLCFLTSFIWLLSILFAFPCLHFNHCRIVISIHNLFFAHLIRVFFFFNKTLRNIWIFSSLWITGQCLLVSPLFLFIDCIMLFTNERSRCANFIIVYKSCLKLHRTGSTVVDNWFYCFLGLLLVLLLAWNHFSLGFIFLFWGCFVKATCIHNARRRKLLRLLILFISNVAKMKLSFFSSFLTCPFFLSIILSDITCSLHIIIIIDICMTVHWWKWFLTWHVS